MEPALISSLCNARDYKSLWLPLGGRDTNPSQVSFQQTLLLIYLPRKNGELS